jgi:hypothetical protein
MKKLIAGLVVFTLLATAGIAMGGASEISVRTELERGDMKGKFCIHPDYLEDPHEFAYTNKFKTGSFAEGVKSFTYTSVPADLVDPVPEDKQPATMFYQTLSMVEAGHKCGQCGGQVDAEGCPGGGGKKCCGAYFFDALSIYDIASDADQRDDAMKKLDICVTDTGEPKDFPGVSKDLKMETSWVSNGADYLAFTQDVEVQNKHICGDKCRWPDAIGDLDFCATYGDADADNPFDYSYDVEMWGKGLEFEFDWLIGTLPEPAVPPQG